MNRFYLTPIYIVRYSSFSYPCPYASSYNLIMICFDSEDYKLVHGGFHTVDEAVLSDSRFGVDEICQCANDAANANSDRT